jgi:hypothetical protein
MEWLLDVQESTAVFMLGCILVGVVVFGVFIAAYKRKGRVAFFMLPMVLWFIFWLSWRDQRGDAVSRWLRIMDRDGEYELISFGGHNFRGPGSMEWPAGIWNYYQLIENAIGMIVLLLALKLIFKKDKPAITTTESEEPSKPV